VLTSFLAFFIVGNEASKHYSATREYWSFVTSMVTEVTGADGSGVKGSQEEGCTLAR
jgi:hypothetical protein